jgi:hypothetical protein
MEFREHRAAELDREALPERDQGRNRSKPYSGQRDDGGHGIVLPVDRADVGGGQDRSRDKEVIDHLEGAVDLRVVPGPGVVEGVGEERCVIVWQLFTELFSGKSSPDARVSRTASK